MDFWNEMGKIQCEGILCDKWRQSQLIWINERDHVYLVCFADVFGFPKCLFFLYQSIGKTPREKDSTTYFHVNHNSSVLGFLVLLPRSILSRYVKIFLLCYLFGQCQKVRVTESFDLVKKCFHAGQLLNN